MRSVRLGLILAVMLAGCSPSPSPSPARLGMVTGTVTDATGSPIVDAAVDITRITSEAQTGTGLGTDQSGKYRSGPVIVGQYVVHVQLDGWITQQKTVLVREGDPTVVDFVLAPHGPPL
jgi:hypothetical protein